MNDLPVGQRFDAGLKSIVAHCIKRWRCRIAVRHHCRTTLTGVVSGRHDDAAATLL